MSQSLKLPTFLDFEASSLSSSSYPIEVAWSRNDGSIESHLISPADISGWDDWSVVSQTVHGIEREELLELGKSPEWICNEMNQQLGGKTVYTDNPLYDGMWLASLFTAVDHARLKFELGLADEIIFRGERPGQLMSLSEYKRIQELKVEARMRVGGQHRAKLDVQYLVELYKLANPNNDL